MEFGGCPIEQEAAREKSPYRSFLVLAELKTNLKYPAELNPRAFRRLQQNTEGGWPVREKETSGRRLAAWNWLRGFTHVPIHPYQNRTELPSTG